MIIGNKIDMRESRPEEEIQSAFGLRLKTNFGTQVIAELEGKPVKLFMCSVVKKTGI